MITALILAPNLILKEEQCQREHSRRRDTDIHTTELAGHLTHLQLSMRTTHSPPCMLLQSTAPWTLQSPDDFPACLQCPQNPFISQDQAATKSSSIPLSGLDPPLSSPAAAAKRRSLPEKPDLVLFFTLFAPTQEHAVSTAHSALLTQHNWGERGFPFFPLPELSSASC